MDRQTKAYLYAGATVVLWSTVASAFKLTLAHLSFIEMLLGASLVSLAALFIILLAQGKLAAVRSCSGADLARSAVLGFLNPFLYYVILFKAYSLLPAQEAQPLNWTWPIMLVLLSIAILKQPIRWASVLAIVVSFLGVLVISTRGDVLAFRFTNLPGALLALGSSVIWALFWIYNVKDRRDEIVKLFLNFVFGSIFTLAAVLLFGEIRVAATCRHPGGHLGGALRDGDHLRHVAQGPPTLPHDGTGEQPRLRCALPVAFPHPLHRRRGNLPLHRGGACPHRGGGCHPAVRRPEERVMMNGSFEEIRKGLLESGAALVGFADMTAIPPEERKGMDRALSIAVALNPAIVSRITKGPTKEYFREYQRANALLSELAHKAAKLLQERGFAAIALEPTTEEFDAEKLRAGLSHKIAATRSGLGWIGKNALVITKPFGSAIRLTTVLTDALFETGHPFNESKCGTCSACVEICPAHAPTGTNWRLGLCRDDFFDAFACCRKATEFCEREQIDSTICGICIEACPWTRKYLKKAARKK